MAAVKVFKWHPVLNPEVLFETKERAEREDSIIELQSYLSNAVRQAGVPIREISEFVVDFYTAKQAAPVPPPPAAQG